MWQNQLLEPAASVRSDSVTTALETIFSRPEYRWGVTRNPFATITKWIEWAIDQLDVLRENHPVAYFSLLTVLLLVLGAIVLHAIYLLKKSLKSAADQRASEGLPTNRKKNVRYHLDEARRLAGQGSFAEALGHRFTALLLELERRNILEFNASTTPAEYLNGVRLPERQREQLGWLVNTLYEHMFGYMGCSSDDFSEFNERADRLVTEVAV